MWNLEYSKMSRKEGKFLAKSCKFDVINLRNYALDTESKYISAMVLILLSNSVELRAL